MDCPKCHKKSVDKNHKCQAPTVLQIEQAPKIVTFHTVAIPAAMGDDTAVPPVNGKYHNTVLHYEANGAVYLYNSDGIPVKLSAQGTLYFNELLGRPMYAGVSMTSTTRIPAVNDGTLSILRNNVVLASFSANSNTETAVDIEVPTATSDLSNDSDYQTGDEVTAAITAAIGEIAGIQLQVVSELPAQGTGGIIYLVPNSGTAPDIYEEYVWVNGAWERIGSTETNLEGYVRATGTGAIRPLIDSNGTEFQPATSGAAVSLGGGLTASKTDLLNLFYPVGSYYETSNTAFDPNTAWGGTWVEDSAGRVMVAQNGSTFSTVGGVGGEEAHTLTVAETPHLTGRIQARPVGNLNAIACYPDIFQDGVFSFTDQGGATWVNDAAEENNSDNTMNALITFDNGGQDLAHNNLQPYVVVKRWHRTA